MSTELKEATAQTCLEVWVTCPYCNDYQEQGNKLREFVEDDLRNNDMEAEVTCEDVECQKEFLVTEITY